MTPHTMTPTQSRAIELLATDNLDDLKKTLVFWLAFGVRWNFSDNKEPRTIRDFSKCVLLLRDIPGLRDSLSTLAQLSPLWAEIVSRWDELEAILEDESHQWVTDPSFFGTQRIPHILAACRQKAICAEMAEIEITEPTHANA